MPGEIVTLGNGDRGRLLWHSPRKNPTTSYLALIGDFDDAEDKNPTAYPSCVGVSSVGVPRMRGSDDDHRGDRGVDDMDPMQRGRRGGLNM